MASNWAATDVLTAPIAINSVQRPFSHMNYLDFGIWCHCLGVLHLCFSSLLTLRSQPCGSLAADADASHVSRQATDSSIASLGS